MRRRTVIAIAVVVPVIAGAAWLIAWGLRPDRVAGPCAVVTGPVMLPDIHESSGLAVSRRTPGVLWSHNDSGNAATLFALDTTGALRGRVRVPIETRDWEDVSAAHCPSGACLYIADIGDNREERSRIRLYRVPEPSPTDAETSQPEVFEATYADGPHNAEAMFVLDTALFIVTRDRTGGVYRAQLTGSRNLTFQRIAELGLAAVTDAEASPNELAVVVRTPREAVFYFAAELSRGGNVPYLRVPINGLKEPQGEGVAFDGNMLYLSSEGRGGSRDGQFLGLRCNWSR